MTNSAAHALSLFSCLHQRPPSPLRLPPPPRHLRHLPFSLVFIFVRRHGHRLDHRDPPPLLSLSFLSLCCRRYRRTPETPPPPLSSPTTAPTVYLLLCPQEKLPSSSSSAAPLLASVDGTSVAVAISFDPRGPLLPNFAASLFCPSFLLLLRRDPVAAAEAIASILRRRPHRSPSSSAVAASLPSLSLLRRHSRDTPPRRLSSLLVSSLPPLNFWLDVRSCTAGEEGPAFLMS